MVPRRSNFSFISNKLVGSLPFHPHNVAKHWQKITVHPVNTKQHRNRGEGI